VDPLNILINERYFLHDTFLLSLVAGKENKEKVRPIVNDITRLFSRFSLPVCT
jgi:hypothetical protein